MIAVGDFRQLPPFHYFGNDRVEVDLRGERQFVFHLPLWRETFGKHTIQLSFGHRQAGDSAYWELLQRMRVGQMTDADHALLEKQVLGTTLPLFKLRRLLDAIVRRLRRCISLALCVTRTATIGTACLSWKLRSFGFPGVC